MRIMSFVFILVFVLCCHSGYGQSGNFLSTKYWNRSTNFFNEENWQRNELPCSSDRIIFPKSVSLISVLKNVEVSQIMMPLNGEFIFGPDMMIGATPPSELHKSSCPGKDRRFIRWRPLSWFDPSNWCEKLDDGHCVRPAVEAAAVPSMFDSVVFPTGTDSYFVDIDYDESISVGRLNFRLQWQTTHGFRLFTSSKDGRKEFVNTLKEPVPTVTITTTGCKDSRGCVPDTLQDKKLFKKICSKVQCLKAKCDKPLTVTGACCPFCGSTVVARIGSAFTFTSFARQIRLMLRKHSVVQLSVMRITTSSVQIAMTDPAGGEFVEKAVPYVVKFLKTSETNSALTSFQVRSSKGPRIDPQRHSGGVGVKSKKAIIVFVALFIAAVLFALAALLYRRASAGQLTLPSLSFRNRLPNFRFSWSRFGESGGDASSGAGVVQMELSSPGLAIQNPIYRGHEINVTPLDDSYDQPMSGSSILTNPAFVPSKSDEEVGPKDVQQPVDPPGTMTVVGEGQLAVTNLAFRSEENEDASEA